MIQPVISLASSAVPVTVDDVLHCHVNFTTPLATILILRLLQLDEKGEIIVSVETFNLAAGTTDADLTLRLTNGILANISVSTPTGNINFGGIFATLFIRRGAPTAANQDLFLTSGFITSNVGLTFPNGGQIAQSQAWSPVTTESFTSPAPGADFNITLNDGFPTQLVGMYFEFTTDATAADRTIRLRWRVDGIVRFRSATRTLIAAGQSWLISSIPATDLIADNPVVFFGYLPIPQQYEGQPLTINSDTLNIQAGDQFGNITAFYRTQPPLI